MVINPIKVERVDNMSKTILVVEDDQDIIWSQDKKIWKRA